jgi:predicted tellurium resistance membrane protein TerC
MRSLKERAAIEQAIVGGVCAPMIFLGVMLVVFGAITSKLSTHESLAYIACGVTLAIGFAILAHNRLVKWRRNQQAPSK